MKRYLTTFTLILFAAGLISTSGKAPVHPVGKDISVLCDALLGIESKNPTTIDEMKTFVSQVETMAEPYFQGKKKSVSKREKTFQVLDDVAQYVNDIKMNGATFDMRDGGLLLALIYHYKTALHILTQSEQCGPLAAAAVKNEAEAWLKLEKTLCDYYASSSYILNEGGSISHLVSSGCAWSLAEARYNETEKMLKSGLGSSNTNVITKDKIEAKSKSVVAELKGIADRAIHSCSDDFKEGVYFGNVSNGLNEAVANLNDDMKAWIDARIKLLSYSKDLNDQVFGTTQTMSLFEKITGLAEPEK